MTRSGGGLNHFPPGREEQALRDERRKMIREARRHRERVVIDGKRYWLVRLPDGHAADYAVRDDGEEAA